MSELNKSLGVVRGTALMLNIVLGAGLLTLPGLAAQAVGQSAVFVWIACALAAAPLLWVFAVLGRRYPEAGGIASVMGHAFGKWGRVPATLLFLGAVALGLPSIALTGGYYIAEIFSGPPWLYATGLIISALSVNFLSTETAGKINTLISSLVILFIVAIACLSLISLNLSSEGISTLRIENIPGTSQFIFVFMMVFFAFTGWEVSASLGEEFRNPQRDLPRAMALSFITAVGLYLTLAFVAVKAGDAGKGAAPFASIFERSFGSVGLYSIVSVSTLLIFANLSSAIWAVSRMVYSTARDGLLPSVFSRTHDGIPTNAIILTVVTLLAVIGMTGLGVLDIGQTLAAAGQNFLLLYAGAALSLLHLTNNLIYRVLSLFCLVLVAFLLFERGFHGAIYPVFIIISGFSISFFKKKPDNI